MKRRKEGSGVRLRPRGGGKMWNRRERRGCCSRDSERQFVRKVKTYLQLILGFRVAKKKEEKREGGERKVEGGGRELKEGALGYDARGARFLLVSIGGDEELGGVVGMEDTEGEGEGEGEGELTAKGE
jgi:hypothetical protein